MLCVSKQYGDIGFFDFFPGAFDAEAFDLVASLVQAGGIDDV